jgi:hypothetical protein
MGKREEGIREPRDPFLELEVHQDMLPSTPEAGGVAPPSRAASVTARPHP